MHGIEYLSPIEYTPLPLPVPCIAVAAAVAFAVVAVAKTLDADTKVCRTPAGLKVLAIVVGVVFGITEMAGHFLR